MTQQVPRRSKVGKVWVVLCSHLTAVGLARAVVLWVHVKALGVTGIAHGGLYRTLVAAVKHVVPVRLAEEGVRLYAGCAAADVTETTGTIDGAEGAYYVFGVFREWRVLREDDGFFQDSA